MNEFTPLVRPPQPQISFDSAARNCQYDGFNYPTFRQLAKNVRLPLSQPLKPTVETPYYRLLSISNVKGWFGAIKTPNFGSGSELIFSPLGDLRSACEAAKPDDKTLYTPQRAQAIPTKANIIAFACGDTKILVGLEDGSVVVYDASAICTPGTNDVQPLGRIQLQSTPLRQVLPNPASEQSLSDLFAVVGDGKVYLLNMQLQPQGGWEGSDLMTQPIVVDWSPKGKHIAIGLQTGDILTFSLTNKSTPNKHFPPTFNSLLVSMNWLGPGHTFRTSYEAVNGTAIQHIISLDAKSSVATYFSPEHPYLSGDRKNQAAYVLNFPKWDADSAASDENKSLLVVGDFASIDLEILGNIGGQWYRQMQESPLSLPLDADLNDTMILGFQADLTDPRYDSPIMYAYLDDGTLQGWYVEHTKPYLGMMNGKSFGSITNTAAQMATDDKPKAADTGISAFGQASVPVSAFGQSSFGQQVSSPFGGQTTSTFGQTGFGQQSNTTTSPFGQAPPSTPAFGQSSFGQPSGFGALSSGGFGQSFGSSAFGSGSTSPPNAFSALVSTPNVFSQGSFGSPVNPSSGLAPPQPEMTREASMSDSTSGFGGMSLGGNHPTDSNAVNSMFGNFSPPSSASTLAPTSAFGGSIVKPASGAFGNFGTSGAFGATKLPETISAFAPIAQTSATASPAFGQTGFGQPSFGQSSFGKTSFGAPPVAQQQKPAVTSGGFSAFATSTPTTFGTAPESTTINAPAKPATEGGFSAFASTGNSSAAKPSGGGFSAFASSGPSVFGNAITEPSSSSQTTFLPVTTAIPAVESKPRTSVFGTPTAVHTAGTSSVKSSFEDIRGESQPGFTRNPSEISPPSSPSPKPVAPRPENTASLGSQTTASSPNTGAFANLQASPSPFSGLKPASGFGAFGGGISQNSVFFKKPDETPQQVTAFSLTPTTPKTPTGSSSHPAFGSTSTLGASKSPFGATPNQTPTKMGEPISGGFSAFSKTGSAFGPSAGNKSSFADLLKTGGEESTDPVKPAVSVFSKPEGQTESVSVFGRSTQQPVVSAFPPIAKTNESTTTSSAATSSTAPKPAFVSAFPPIKKPESETKTEPPAAESKVTKAGVQAESSYGNISVLSASTSSFVEVGAEEVLDPSGSDLDEREEGEIDEEDKDSFLSEDFEESSYRDGDSANEDEDADADADADANADAEGVPDERNSPSPEIQPPVSPRSPSATPTPQTEIPTIEVSPSADDKKEDIEKEESSSPSPKAFVVEEQSTTPPSSPVKDNEPKPFGQGSPLSTPGTPATFSLGLGRPSTRPVRSSPLSKAVSIEDEDEETPASPPAKALPTPVSPRPVYGVLPADEKGKRGEKEEPAPVSPTMSNKRPKTPPLLSTMAPSTPKSPVLPPAKIPAAELDATPSKPGPFSGAPSTPEVSETDKPGPSKAQVQRAQTPPTAAASPFGPPPATPGPSVKGNSFGGVPPPIFAAVDIPLGKGSIPIREASNVLDNKPSPGTPTPNLFAGASPSPPHKPTGSGNEPNAAPAIPAAKRQAAQSTVSAMEEGMQKESLILVMFMTDEFTALKKFAFEGRKQVSNFSKAIGGSRLRMDLADPTKWGLGDLAQFGKLLLEYETELPGLEEHVKKEKEMIHDLNTAMLKAETRKEEIARFQKAKTDPEFAKMLKSRTLGPELTESQTRLRKDIRTIRDRVEKLESRLQENKSKLAQAASCKPTVKPPSLDTINRTYRNIEIAIDQQADEVSRLASRINKLNLTSTSRGDTPVSSSEKEKDRGKGKQTTTPSIPAATAAALNAERAATKLKHALLAARKTPLLNTKASAAPSAPVSFQTPEKLKVQKNKEENVREMEMENVTPATKRLKFDSSSSYANVSQPKMGGPPPMWLGVPSPSPSPSTGTGTGTGVGVGAPPSMGMSMFPQPSMGMGMNDPPPYSSFASSTAHASSSSSTNPSNLPTFPSKRIPMPMSMPGPMSMSIPPSMTMPTPMTMPPPMSMPPMSSMPMSMPMPDWDNIPEDNFSPLAPGQSVSTGRRGAGSGQRKHAPVPKKRSDNSGSSGGSPGHGGSGSGFGFGSGGGGPSSSSSTGGSGMGMGMGMSMGMGMGMGMGGMGMGMGMGGMGMGMGMGMGGMGMGMGGMGRGMGMGGMGMGAGPSDDEPRSSWAPPPAPPAPSGTVFNWGPLPNMPETATKIQMPTSFVSFTSGSRAGSSGK